MNKQWGDFAPRLGLVWDPQGNGRTSVRASFGVFYDIPDAQYNLTSSEAPPWAARPRRLPAVFANPYGSNNQANPFPLVLNANTPFTPNGAFVSFNYDTHPTQVQSYNLSIQRQIAADWLVSASYLGSHMIHLPDSEELNPAIYLGTGPCTLNGVSYPACSIIASNTAARRLPTLLNPAEGKYFAYTEVWEYNGTGSYDGLLLFPSKTSQPRITFNGNYTWSHCISDPVNTLPNAGAGGVTFSDPSNREFDRAATAILPEQTGGIS